MENRGNGTVISIFGKDKITIGDESLRLMCFESRYSYVGDIRICGCDAYHN